MSDQIAMEQLTLFDDPEEGKWVPIKKGQRGYSVSDFICSKCGKPCPCYILTEYCPRCGTKMKR